MARPKSVVESLARESRSQDHRSPLNWSVGQTTEVDHPKKSRTEEREKKDDGMEWNGEAATDKHRAGSPSRLPRHFGLLAA